MKKSLLVTILLVLALTSVPAFALSIASERAIEAFNRYEPDFANSLRKLEELDRKVENQNIDLESQKYKDIVDDADDIMDYVQKRYDLMEDLFTTVSGDYPLDRAELFESFSRIDDLYRETRNFYLERFVNGNRKKSSAVSSAARSKAASVESAQKTVGVSGVSDAKKPSEKETEYRKVEISGTLKLDL